MERKSDNHFQRSPDPPNCYHCGLPCERSDIVLEEKHFCCAGCKMVYEILSENQLCQYYSLNDSPGTTPQFPERSNRFSYLDDDSIQQQLKNFSNGKLARVTFYIPNIHCSSCIWLLENLYQIAPGISDSRINFLRKELSLTFLEQETSLRAIVELLASLGYEPLIRLDTLNSAPAGDSQKSLYLKIGVAGFCFGNIMLLSFPEYLDIGGTLSGEFQSFFGFLNILLALPVLLYSAGEYLQSAYRALIHKSVTIEVPISLGILAMFGRSLYEILSGVGSGYMDSFAALIFLLLVGKLFQKKTYDTLSFERDYTSFFPISVTRKAGEVETGIPLSRLKVGDRIVVRHQELIPADAVLIEGAGMIDYSFVTGEAEPQPKRSGDLLYAGGRQIGGAVELEVVKEVSQSYLTQLWNHQAFSQPDSGQLISFTNAVSKYFTVGIIAVALLAALYWWPQDAALALNAFTAVLIIACPCALALSTPFTLGNVLRIFGRNQFYLKNTAVIETLARITAIVFDKTGTLTRSRSSLVEFVSLNGSSQLRADQKRWVKSLVRHSRHPLSFTLFNALNSRSLEEVRGFREVAGEGIEGTIDGHSVQVGSPAFVGADRRFRAERDSSTVFLSIDKRLRGYFKITQAYRPGLAEIIGRLGQRYHLSLLSGDRDREKARLRTLFGSAATLRFQQSPHDKLAYIQELQEQNETVLMIGDGLNDAGALRKSEVGISISEDLNSFSPACDAILEAGYFSRLADFLRFSQLSMHIIRINLLISLLYNTIGLGFAVQGTLSPLICAILMPISSISVIVFSTGATNLLARWFGLHVGRKAAPLPAAETKPAAAPLPPAASMLSSLEERS